MQDVALFFKLKDEFQGPGFKAMVKVEGRALMAQEDDGLWWLFGVNPGGMAESGDTPEAAYGAFRSFFKGILTDFATESADFEAFQLKVNAFICQTDDIEADRWNVARDAARKGTVNPADLFQRLFKITKDVPHCQVDFVLMRTEPVVLSPEPAKLVASNEDLELAA